MMNRVIRNYIGFQVFFGLLLWVPIFYEFQRRMGLSDPEIFQIQSLYYLAFCFLEIPTGMIADRWGYRKGLLLGSSVLVAANLMVLLVTGFSGFLVHFVLIAAARSLISGAASAYLYEYMCSQGAREDYKQIEGRARSWALYAKVVAWSGVGVLMEWNVYLPYALTAVSATVAAGFAYRFPHSPKPAEASAPGKPQGSAGLVGATRDFLSKPRLFWLMLQGAGIFVLVRVLQVNLFQPLLREKGFSVESFGLLMSAMTIAEAVGASNTRRLRGRVSDLGGVWALTLVLCAALASLAPAGWAGTVAGLIVFSGAAGLAFPLQKQLLNDAMGASKHRATLLSLESILDRTLCAAAVLPLGGLLAEGRIGEVLTTAGFVAAFAVTIVYTGLKINENIRRNRAPAPDSSSVQTTRERVH